MEVSNIVLQYVKIFLSWPIVVFVLVVIFIRQFKEPISSFISRLVKSEFGSFKLQTSSPEQQKKEAREIPQTQSEDELENYVRNNPRQAIKTIIDISRNFRFERIFNIIYGSQIRLLLSLRLRGDSGDKYINLCSYYDDYINRSRLYSAKTEDYFGFLYSMKLIEYFGEIPNYSVKITPEGIDFLSYIKNEYPTTFKYKPF